MWLDLIVVPWLVCAGALHLPAPGTTLWTTDSCSRAEPWTATLTAPHASWLLVELSPAEAFADIDLRVGGDGWEAYSASHLGDEKLLLPVLAGERLELSVSLAEGEAAAFKLGVTSLLASGRLEGGAGVDAPLASEVSLYTLVRPLQQRVVLSGRDPGAPVEVLLFDERMDLTGSAVVGGSERAELNPAADPAGGGELLAVVRCASGFRLELGAEEEREEGHLEGFLLRLAKTPAQKLVLRALARNPDFQRLSAYLEGYPGGLPLRLLVVPGLKAHGIERFGTYSRGTLAINPTIAGHQTNPQELVDTLIHELVHAVLSLPRARRYPLAPDVLDSSHDARLRGLGGAPLKRGVAPEPYASYLERDYGPSASNPNEDYTDINAGAQRLVIKVIVDNLRRTRLGQRTLVFKNAERRSLLSGQETK